MSQLTRRAFVALSAATLFVSGGHAKAQGRYLFETVKKLASGEPSVAVGISGDSTGNEKWEWVYETFARLAESFGYTLDYRLYVDGVGYKAQKSLVGGGKLLTVYNCSVPGKTYNYILSGGRNVSSVFPEPLDLLVTSYGYNHLREKDFGSMLRKTIEAVKVKYPDAEVAVVVQPTKASSDPDSLGSFERGLSARLMAIQNGHKVIDVASGFRGNPHLVSADGIHPNRDGQAVWTDIAYSDLTTQL